MSVFINAKELKEQASIVDLLDRLGYKPAKKSPREYLYHSMLREDDRNPSFSVNDDLGVWFDHGLRKGGNIVDFGLAFWKELNFNEVVEKIQETCAIVKSERTFRPRKAVKIPHYIVSETKDIGTHPAITDYLKGRGIFDTARSTMNEVYYFVEDQKGLKKHFFAAGWKNENNGWELRNKYFKGCLGLKGVTFVPGHQKNVSIFEGFINYVSWKTENPDNDRSVIVLNTLALLKIGIAKAKLFSSIDLYFDRDHAGHGAAKEFITALPYASDCSASFEGFNDYNDKLIAGLQGNQVVNSIDRKEKSAYSM